MDGIDTYIIKDVKIVPGNSIVHFWSKDMQKIETDKGVFIADIPDKGHDWSKEIGKTVTARISQSRACSKLWLNYVDAGLFSKNESTIKPAIKIEEEKLPYNYDINKNPELIKAYNYIKQNVPVIFLTGGAGTGKSTFIKFLKNNVKRELNKNCIVLAPTGVAAINVAGQTIHKFFNFPFDPFSNEKVIPSIRKNPVVDYTDLIIIDEISMVRSSMLDHIDYALRLWCDKDKPFGGKQLLLIGDCFQLPPVKSEEDKNKTKEERADMEEFFKQWDNQFFFAAKALSNVDIKAIQLKKIYRQQNDELFIHILNRIRRKEYGYKNDIDFLNKNCFIENRIGKKDVPEECLLLTTTNANADGFNNEKIELLQRNGVKSVVYKAFIKFEDKDDYNPKSFLTPEELTLCIGAKVMVTKNINEQKLVNGDMGRVVGLGGDGSSEDDYVEIQISKKKYRLTRETWQSFKYKKEENTKSIKQEVTGTFKQIPLKLGWAVTIHKSQGLTLNEVALDVPSAWEPGQVYVALSRVKSLNGLFLCQKLTADSVITDSYVEGKYKELFPEVEENKFNEDEYKNIVFDNEKYLTSSTDSLSSVKIGGFEFKLYLDRTKGEKIGRFAEETISKLLINNLIPEEELNRLLSDIDYCYSTFGISYNFAKANYTAKFTLLRKDRDENAERYWAKAYKGYYICSQWYPSCISKLAKWLIALSENKLPMKN